jgi:hypothetical protein
MSGLFEGRIIFNFCNGRKTKKICPPGVVDCYDCRDDGLNQLTFDRNLLI